MRGRYANLAELDEEDRENKLEVKTVEYLVHGIFARSEKGMGEGKNGLPGAFWFDLDKILATITEDDLKQKLQAFDQAQHRRRATRRSPPRSSARRPGWPPRRRKADIK